MMASLSDVIIVVRLDVGPLSSSLLLLLLASLLLRGKIMASVGWSDGNVDDNSNSSHGDSNDMINLIPKHEDVQNR